MEFVAPGEDLYAALGVGHDATPQEIKRAYHQAALKCHPDRCVDKAQATRLFQKLGFIASILTDPEKRRTYDETGDFGMASEELDGDALQQWKDFFACVFKTFTQDDIGKFAAEYKGSASEREDLRRAYELGRGSMDAIMENVLLTECDEEDRYRAIVEEMFAANTLQPTPLWTTTNTPAAIRKRRKAEDRERALAEKLNKRSKAAAPKADDLDALTHAITERRRSNFDDLVAQLERTYGAKGSPNGPSGAKRGSSTGRKPKKAAKKK